MRTAVNGDIFLVSMSNSLYGFEVYKFIPFVVRSPKGVSNHELKISLLSLKITLESTKNFTVFMVRDSCYAASSPRTELIDLSKT